MLWAKLHPVQLNNATLQGPSDPALSWPLSPTPGLSPSSLLQRHHVTHSNGPSVLRSNSSLCSCYSPAWCALPSAHLPNTSPLFQGSFKAPLQSLSWLLSMGNADLSLRILPSLDHFLHFFNIHKYLVGTGYGARCLVCIISNSGSNHVRRHCYSHLLMRTLGLREVKDWSRLSQTLMVEPEWTLGLCDSNSQSGSPYCTGLLSRVVAATGGDGCAFSVVPWWASLEEQPGWKGSR